MPYTSVREIELVDVGSLGKETLVNDGLVNLERGISGTATIVLSNADYPLSATEGQAFVLILTGTVTDDLSLIVPQESRVYVVDNRCTIVGTHSITMRPPVGGGVTVETGYQRALMYCDGSNVYPVASGTAAGGGAGAPTDASYLVGSAHALLSGERVVTDTSTITWDLATAGQARAIIPPDAISYTHLQNVSSSRILGRFTGGAGDVQEIIPGTGLSLDAGTGVLSATAVGQPLDATLTALAGLTTGANLLPYFTGVDTVTTTTLSAFVRTILDDADAATARGTLGAQASDATLTALAGVTTGADTLPFFTGVDTASTTTLTAFMRGLLDDPDAATARGTLLLGTMAQQNASAVAITGGSATLTDLEVDSPTLVVDLLNHRVGMGRVNPAFKLHVEGTFGAAQNAVFGAAVGIGVDPPAHHLDVAGNGRVTGTVGIGGVPYADSRLVLLYPKATGYGVTIQPTEADGGAGSPIFFRNQAGSPIGSIAATGSSVAYNTTSDTRLKHAIAALTGALDVVRALNPVAYVWNANNEPGTGFLAHELMRQVPEAVSGEPDAVNDDGSVRPQQVDHSKIVPWLAAAVQELSAQVQTLTARVATLEAQLS